VEAALTLVARRRAILAMWLALAGLAAAIAVVESIDRRGATGEGPADPRRLLPVAADQLGAIEIADRGRLHRFERDAGGTWLYHGVHASDTAEHTHAPDPALSERIERAVAAFARTRIERELAAGGDAATYGVTAPDVVILVYRPAQRQPLAQYAVGAVAPDTVSRYVAIVGRPSVITIPGYQIDNLLALVQAAASRPPPAVSRP
jgi:hypothetical protein